MDECFVCCEDDNGPLFTNICSCKDRFIHKQCLKKMCEMQSSTSNQGICTVCQKEFQGIRIKTTNHMNKRWIMYMFLKSIFFSCISFVLLDISDLLNNLKQTPPLCPYNTTISLSNHMHPHENYSGCVFILDHFVYITSIVFSFLLYILCIIHLAQRVTTTIPKYTLKKRVIFHDFQKYAVSQEGYEKLENGV